ncbi:MAG: YceD family protein [bacterium]
MKWSIPQLRKLKKPFTFESNLDLNNLIGNMSDVIRTNNCVISGTCREIGDDAFEFDINIKAVLYLECSVTLEEVEFNFESDITELFGYDEEFSSLVNLIEKDTIDLTDVILTEIIVSKPMKIVKEGYEEHFSDEPERRINPAFEGLKDLLGGDNK